MKERLYDFYTSFKFSLKFFLVPLILGILIGGINCISLHRFDIIAILNSIFTVTVISGSFGFLMCIISFVKPTYMRDLNNQNKWRTYFYKFGLIAVVFLISAFFYGYAIIIDLIRFYIRVR